MKYIVLYITLIVSFAFSDTSYYHKGKLTTLTPITEVRSLGENGIKYYRTNFGNKVGVTDEILVKCYQSSDCFNTLDKYNFRSISKVTQTIYLVKIDNENDIFKISQELFLDDNIKFAHPNFIKEQQKR